MFYNSLGFKMNIFNMTFFQEIILCCLILGQVKGDNDIHSVYDKTNSSLCKGMKETCDLGNKCCDGFTCYQTKCHKLKDNWKEDNREEIPELGKKGRGLKHKKGEMQIGCPKRKCRSCLKIEYSGGD